MAIVDRGQIYIPGSVREILNQIIEDYESLLFQAGISSPAIQPGTEPYFRYVAIANAIYSLYYTIDSSLTGASELTATGEDLDDIREAIGLPEITAAAASGKLIASTLANNIFYPHGLQFKTNAGLRGQVNGNQTVSNGGLLNVLMVDPGLASNVDAGETVEWISPPINSLATAVVDSDGLTGGVDAETDAQKRQRIADRRANIPAGGNWSHQREVSSASTGSIQSAFVYPALGGPGTFKVVLQKSMVITGSNQDFSRELSSTVIDTAKNALRNENPSPMKVVVQSVVDEPTDIAIFLNIPVASNSGSAGNGWLDAEPLELTEADNGRITVTDVVSTTSIEISANSTPVIGQRIMWFSPVTRLFISSTITSVSGSAGAWVIGLNTALTSSGNDVAIGDFISPSCTFRDTYRSSILTGFNNLGPGENTADVQRLFRAARKPAATRSSTSYPSDVGVLILNTLTDSSTEIVDADYAYRSKQTPTVPALIQTAPNVLQLRNLGFYKFI